MDTNIFFIGNREKKVEGSAWSLCSGLPLSAAGAARLEDKKTHRRRAAESPRGRAQARQPRTTFSSLLSTLYLPHSWFKFVFRVFRVFRGFLPPTSGDARRNRRAGASKRANHALPSPPFSPISNVYGRRGQSVGRVLTRGSFWGHRVRIPPGFFGHHRCYRGT